MQAKQYLAFTVGILTLFVGLLVPLQKKVANADDSVSVNFQDQVNDPLLQEAITELLSNKPETILPGTQFFVGSARQEGGWVLISLVSLNGTLCEDVYTANEHCRVLVLGTKEEGGKWILGLAGTEIFSTLFDLAPSTFLAPGAKPYLDPLSRTVLTYSYQTEWRFPFEGAWQYWQGWHGGTGGDALDIGGAARNLLTPAGGYISFVEYCAEGDRKSANITIVHDGDVEMQYFHLDRNEVKVTNGMRVEQGQLLGLLVQGSFNDGSCGYADQSNSHVHWRFVDHNPSYTVDGWAINYEADAGCGSNSTWTNNDDSREPYHYVIDENKVVKCQGGELDTLPSTNRENNYKFEYKSQNVPSMMQPGEQYTITFVLTNTGTVEWKREEVFLGTDHYADTTDTRDHPSPFFSPGKGGWASPNRISLIEESVPPGGLGTFQAVIVAHIPGVYPAEHFRPLAVREDFGLTQWMPSSNGSDLNFQLTVTSTCVYTDTTFCDVSSENPFHPNINAIYLAEEQITRGCYQDDSGLYYCPDKAITRAEFALMVARWLYRYLEMESLPPVDPNDPGKFSDVQGDDEVARAIEFLHKDGVVFGFPTEDGPNIFKPDEFISRQHAIYIIMRVLQKHTEVSPAEEDHFWDTDDPLIERAGDFNITSGYSIANPDDPTDPRHKFDGNRLLSRAEAAKFLDQAFLKLSEIGLSSFSDDDPPEDMLELRSNARFDSPDEQKICFTASIDIPIPGLIVVSDGMPACYWYMDNTYRPMIEVNICQLYSVNDAAINNSQFFSINLATIFNPIELIGLEHFGANIEGLDIDPSARHIFASTGDFGSEGSQLYIINPISGELILIGTIQNGDEVAFKGVHSLAFHPNGTLWGFATQGSQMGIIEIDPATAVATLVWETQAPLTKHGMAWQPDGAKLWLSHGNQLYSWSPGDDTLTLEYEIHSLPTGARIEALEFRPDGLLWFAVHNGIDALNLYTFDVETGDILTTDGFETTEFQNITGLAWPDWCTEEFPALTEIGPEGGVASVPGRTDTFVIPAGIFTTNTIVTSQIMDIGASVPTGKLSAGHGVWFKAYQDGVLLEDVTFTTPATLMLNYSDPEIAEVIESSLYVGGWDGLQWTDAACAGYSPDVTANQISVPVCHLGAFGLFGNPFLKTYLPLIFR